ncbi:MAG: response regulator [Chloroflexota bacterium]|nr:response regulator [Chloroflexota bacterium]
MQDKDAAHTTPEGDIMKTLNNVSLSDTQVADASVKEQSKVYRILLVEDDISLAHLEASMLTTQGYLIEVANSGEGAITALEASIPDLVVLDLELPGSLDGWGVFQILRTYASTPVLLTTSAAVTVRQYLRSSDETRKTLDHLPKPYPMQTLLKRVKRMLTITS